MNLRGATYMTPNLRGNTMLMHHRHHRPGPLQEARAVIRGMTPAGSIHPTHHAMNPVRYRISLAVTSR